MLFITALLSIAVVIAVATVMRSRRSQSVPLDPAESMREQIRRENRARLADRSRWLRAAGADFEVRYHRRTLA
jgi:hypothetical protein